MAWHKQPLCRPCCQTPFAYTMLLKYQLTRGESCCSIHTKHIISLVHTVWLCDEELLTGHRRVFTVLLCCQISVSAETTHDFPLNSSIWYKYLQTIFILQWFSSLSISHNTKTTPHRIWKYSTSLDRTPLSRKSWIQFILCRGRERGSAAWGRYPCPHC